MAEPIYGAFGDILQLEEEDKSSSPSYNVYQQQAQQYLNPEMLQYTYGTQQNPVFEWVKTIQTGQKKYDPKDSFDRSMLEEYSKMTTPKGYMTPEDISKQVMFDVAAGIGSQAGVKIGQSLVDPYMQDMQFGDKITTGLKSVFMDDTPFNVISETANLSSNQLKVLDSPTKTKLTFEPELATESAAVASNRLEEFNLRKSRRVDLNQGKEGTSPKYAYPQNKNAPQKLEGVEGVPDSRIGRFGTVAVGTNAQPTSYFETVGDRLYGTEAAKANWSGAAGAAAGSFFISLALTKDPAKAAKTATGTVVGTAIGNALLPGVGGYIGGTIGTALGGRVICNELMRQKLMDRKQVALDYKFTKDYLTPTHVNGYHIWAVWMVKQMRKGKLVKFWKHVAGHRANEIEYIYGKRNRPDYLGKIYRKILEPMCWVTGLFCKQSDWSILYKQKEI